MSRQIHLRDGRVSLEQWCQGVLCELTVQEGALPTAQIQKVLLRSNRNAKAHTGRIAHFDKDFAFCRSNSLQKQLMLTEPQ